MHVLVTGGTGFVGVHTVAALLGAGHTVRLLLRSPDKLLPALAPLGLLPAEVETARGDATDAAAVRAAVHGCDAAVHAAAVFSFDTRSAARIRETNVRATEVVLWEALQAGCDPVVHVSSTVAVLPAACGGRLDADSPPYAGPAAAGEYVRSKAESEQVARRLQAEGAPVVCTYPGAVFGPHDPTLGENTHRLVWILRGLFPMVPPGKLWLSDVRDVASLHARLLTAGRGPRRYVATGHALSMREEIQLLGRLTGRRLPVVELPPRFLLPFAKALAAAQRPLGTHYPADAEGAWLCTRSPEVDAGPTTRELGLTPRPIEETFADAVRSLHARGRISRRQAGLLAVEAQAAGPRSRLRPPRPRTPLRA